MYSHLLHFLTVGLLFLSIGTSMYMAGGLGDDGMEDFDPFIHYGFWPTAILYFLRILNVTFLPQVIFNFMGIVLFNLFPETPSVKSFNTPFICFRIVTRGTFPDLVQKNAQRNSEICSRIGLKNYIIEVVTDHSVDLPKSPQLREVIVPSSYVTKNCTLYKARALNYCLEPGANLLADDDWIVHLDEETLLTESSVLGIVNFVHEGKYHFGQGVITYAKEEIVSWVTTLADLIRVGQDFGMLRFSLRALHRPVFSWKGSFIVARAGAEKEITFDFGEKGSITEDCFFALTAWQEGYTFGFVEGEMLEKSTFSVFDYIRQHKRWITGMRFACISTRLNWWQKAGILLKQLSLATLPNAVLVPLFPLPMWRCVKILFGITGGMSIFLFIFGGLKSFSPRKIGLFKSVFLCGLLPVLIIPVTVVLETLSVLAATFSCSGSSFHIVNKQVSAKSPTNKPALPTTADVLPV